MNVTANCTRGSQLVAQGDFVGVEDWPRIATAAATTKSTDTIDTTTTTPLPFFGATGAGTG